MKRCILFLCALLLFLTGCAGPGQTTPDPTWESSTSGEQETVPAQELPQKGEELRAVWVSYSELSMQAEGGGTPERFRAKIQEMFDAAKKLGLNTVIVHVRAFSDAFYPSAVYPWSRYLTGTEGQDPGYDPLGIMVEEAHARALSLHAWFNPYRVSYSNDFTKLSPDNPARKWHDSGDPALASRLIVLDNGIYYNPACAEVQRMILDGVREIVRGYAVDAIHMDDYFYPSEDPAMDAADYTAYCAAGGQKPLADWRRENVNNFVSGLYAAVKAISPAVQVGISPAGDVSRNREKLYADVAQWCARPGYTDYIMPQLYYGFENGTHPFARSVEEWEALVTCDRVRLYYGLALYKSGEEDAYAGPESAARDTGRYEWIRQSDIISRQLALLRGKSRYEGFSLYSYTSACGQNQSENIKKEVELLKSML